MHRRRDKVRSWRFRGRSPIFRMIVLAVSGCSLSSAATAQTDGLPLSELLKKIDSAYQPSSPYVVDSVTYTVPADTAPVDHPDKIVETGVAIDFFRATVYPREGILLDQTHPKLRDAYVGRPTGTVSRGEMYFAIMPGSRIAASRDLGPEGAIALTAARAPSSIPAAIRTAIADDHHATAMPDGAGRIKILVPKWNIEFTFDAHDFTLLKQVDARGDRRSDTHFTDFQSSSIFKARFPRLVVRTFTTSIGTTTQVQQTWQVFDAPVALPQLNKQIVQWTTYADEARDEVTGITLLADGSKKTTPPPSHSSSSDRDQPSKASMEELRVNPDAVVLPQPNRRLQHTLLGAGAACFVAGILWTVRRKLHG